MKGFSIKAFLVVCLGCSVSYSQVRERMERVNDSRVFYYDEFGWRLSIGAGTVLADKLDIFFDDTCTENFNDNESFSANKKICPESGDIDVGPAGAREIYRHDYLAPTELKETLYPSVALRLEYKPFRGFAADFEVAYFRHKIENGIQEVRKCDPTDLEAECGIEYPEFIGNRDNLMVIVGGDYYFDNRSIVTPYISANAGVSNSFVNLALAVDNVDDWSQNPIVVKCKKDPLKICDYISDWALVPVAQVGAGVNFDVGPLTLGTNYNFLYLGGNTFDYEMEDATNHIKEKGSITLRNSHGHRLELRISTSRALF